MPYLIETIKDREKMTQFLALRIWDRPASVLELVFGRVQEADRLEVWGSSFTDSGPDWCEYRLMRGDVAVAEGRTSGY
jgi:hypothetical protein